MTFEEYKAQQEQSRSKPTYNIRKANEGEKGKAKAQKEVRKLGEEEQEEEGSLFFPKKVNRNFPGTKSTKTYHRKSLRVF